MMSNFRVDEALCCKPKHRTSFLEKDVPTKHIERENLEILHSKTWNTRIANLL